MARRKNQPVQLGNRVKDRVSGLVGVAYQAVEVLGAVPQFAVQPEVTKKEPTKYPEGFNFDTNQLEFVDDGVVDQVSAPDDVTVNLGDKVRDKVTNITGTTVIKVTFLNGCVYFTIQPEAKDEKATEAPKQLFVSHLRLEVLEKGVIPLPAPKAEATPRKPPGGPVMPAYRL